MMKALVMAFASLSLAVLPACSAQEISPEAIAGTYAVTITDEALAAAGTPFIYRIEYKDKQWILEFTPDGVYHWYAITPVGVVERAYGDISLTANQILFKKDHGEMSCTERGGGYDFTEEGTYQWKLDGDQLTFELIDEECEMRGYALAVQPWIRQP